MASGLLSFDIKKKKPYDLQVIWERGKNGSASLQDISQHKIVWHMPIRYLFTVCLSSTSHVIKIR